MGEAPLFPVHGVERLKFRTFPKDACKKQGEGEGDRQTLD